MSLPPIPKSVSVSPTWLPDQLLGSNCNINHPGKCLDCWRRKALYSKGAARCDQHRPAVWGEYIQDWILRVLDQGECGWNLELDKGDFVDMEAYSAIQNFAKIRTNLRAQGRFSTFSMSIWDATCNWGKDEVITAFQSVDLIMEIWTIKQDAACLYINRKYKWPNGSKTKDRARDQPRETHPMDKELS